ncbi:MarR family winged helix-turn-helix transcriptional regulator [Furfurilactobacillus sp. WILCCON 0119]|uniref:MarR family winged helix-turn-helix transcriptional regulator n=1 Tax=Furfurilactobacillus entadae TaxID=2922307 RepID=UPI0035E540CA
MQDMERLGKWIAMYNRTIQNWLATALKDFPELNETNFDYVLIVHDHPGISQKELINEVYREQSIIAKSVKYLVSSGWLRMEKDPNDHRISRLYSTEKGEAANAQLKALALQADQFAVTGLTETETRELQRLVQKGLRTVMALKAPGE